MGYYMFLEEESFFIDAENKEFVLEAIKELADKVEFWGGGGSLNGRRAYSFVCTDEFLKADTLEDALEAWRWPCSSGGVIGKNPSLTAAVRRGEFSSVSYIRDKASHRRTGTASI